MICSYQDLGAGVVLQDLQTLLRLCVIDDAHRLHHHHHRHQQSQEQELPSYPTLGAPAWGHAGRVEVEAEDEGVPVCVSGSKMFP